MIAEPVILAKDFQPGMEQPLVSLIIMSYNYSHYIGLTIQSIIDQIYTNWELIIVDDASSDNSVEIIRSFSDPRITLIANKVNQGASFIYNQAYLHCRGEYVGSVDADDYITPDKLQVQVDFMEAHPQVDVVGSYIVQIDSDGGEIDGISAYWVNQERDLNLVDNWALSNSLCHSTVLLRKASHDRVGGLNPELSLAPDFDLWLRCFTQGLTFKVLPEKLAYYRVHPHNVSSTYKSELLFIELSYLFCTHLAGYLTHLKRNDLLEKCYSFFINTYFLNASIQIKMLVLQKLSNFPLYSKKISSFRHQFIESNESLWLSDIKQAPLNRTEAEQYLKIIRERKHKRQESGLLIVDDYFPNIITSFRVHEFNYYFDRLKCEVYSSNGDFNRVWQEYGTYYPEYKNLVKPYSYDRPLNCSLLYIVFLWNAYRMLPQIEEYEVPFIFTLYPGAGFQLNNCLSDLMLQKVVNSKYFRKMIVTQQATYNYVTGNGFCPPDKIKYIYGAVFPTDYYKKQNHQRRFYRQDKTSFDICFVAMKYMPEGIDKGYDVFIKVANKLALFNPDIRFHVVGGFDQTDIDVSALEDNIIYYGLRPTQFFPEFYARMDIIISPNIPFRLTQGSFDGFPTGCCTEAGLCGVAVFCTDELKENQVFVPDQDICIISTDPDEIVRKVLTYFCDLEKLYSLARSGQAKFQEVFSSANQLRPRLELLASYI